ncbi:hypothetical protein O0L34_g16698 [Tuta absoluta]|nr:hypothetical protein O0L34_g16698 [Tuta absoluta]
MLRTLDFFSKFKAPICFKCRVATLQRCFFSQELENKYSETDKEKILRVVNESDESSLSGYEVTKGRLKKFSQWKGSNGDIKNISDIVLIEGFSQKTAAKFCDSILEGPKKVDKATNSKIKGQFLHPTLSESVRKSCRTVLSIYVAVNSVSWTLIDKDNYEVVKWHYHGIDYPDGKRFQITDIFDIAWLVANSMPSADIFVMKAEATTLRAAGSDPNNPKVIAVNLQKAQMVAMIVALLNARSYNERIEDDSSDSEVFKQTVYFLRPTLPYRLYGTLVGNEKVSTDQTVEMLLQDSNQVSKNCSHVYVPENLQTMFRNQKDLQKDMLGHSLLLALTFMDLCIYKNQEKINQLITKRKS